MFVDFRIRQLVSWYEVSSFCFGSRTEIDTLIIENGLGMEGNGVDITNLNMVYGACWKYRGRYCCVDR